MPVDLSGPRMDKMRKRLTDWYAQKRQMLIEAMEQDYPYGSVKLSPEEQLLRFQELTPEDWQAIQARLENRYRGLPNQHQLVEQDIQKYVTRMMTLRAKMLEGRVTNGA